MIWFLDTAARFLPQNVRTITWLYVLSISVVVTELMLALVFATQEADQIEHDTHFIRVASQQIILGERILLATERLSFQDDASIREALREDISQFENAYAEMIAAPTLPESVLKILQSRQQEKTVREVISSFLTQASSFASDPLTGADQMQWAQTIRQNVIPHIEHMTAAFEQDSERNLSEFQSTWRNSIFLAVVILGLEAALVFLPAQRLTQNAFKDIQIKNKDLKRKNNLIEIERNKLLEAISETDALRQEQAEFTYAVSHDMKAPANTIRLLHGELYELLKDHPDEDVGVFLEMLLSTTDRMSLLVEDVLEYTTTLGDVRETQEVDLNALCKEVVQDLQGDIRDANGSVKISDLPIIEGCPSQIRMLFQNLISNGIKFREPGTHSEIQIECTNDDKKECSVQVSDNGIGIAEEDQDRIFGLFDRLHLQEEYAGTGLGLALCRRIIANHSGRIELESTVGEGSQFTVRFPKEQAA